MSLPPRFKLWMPLRFGPVHPYMTSTDQELLHLPKQQRRLQQQMHGPSVGRSRMSWTSGQGGGLQIATLNSGWSRRLAARHQHAAWSSGGGNPVVFINCEDPDALFNKCLNAGP